ncbi:MAG: hypothetical protein ABJA57_08280 [Ginsengibacter sp.]
MFTKTIAVSFLLAVLTSFSVHAQKKAKNPEKKKQFAALRDYLFESDEILHFKLTGRLTNLYNDRYKNIAYHPMLMQYKLNDTAATVNLKVKTRGNFRRRRENCKMPPLMLNFPGNKKLTGTPFENQKRLKLVVPCQGDEYVIREYLVYKMYNLLTDRSFKARLVQVEFEDSASKKDPETHYCFLLEDENRVADRNKSFVWYRKMYPMRATNRAEFTKMAVFEYMIGNTDWSVPYMQNIRLITSDTTRAPYAVPYDFDHAGIVDAPYAGPAPELEISSTRERIYRGFCEKDKKAFAETFALFNKLKDDFYKLYTDNHLLSDKYIKSTIKFLNDFYKVINNDRAIETEFGNPCNTEVRIELKGLED